jgi:hypothetical protein
LRDRFRATVGVVAVSLSLLLTAFSIAPAGAAVSLKVVIIVGPTGAQTDNYRSTGDDIAATATAAGAQVVKVYSPNATWANVRAAVEGANIIVYLGHGNGYPNPYASGAEPTDRDNGWGLNRTTTNGDSDNWSTTMVYCGEQALLGTLTSASTYQWNYCGGKNGTDGIHPAPGFVMIYNKACYTPGAGEGFDTPATEAVAVQRVRNYSYPVLALGASAYFATDMHQGASSLVDLIARNPDMAFGDIARSAPGYDADAHREFDHPDIPGATLWVQRTAEGPGDDPDYWYAYAGNPTVTPSSAGFGLPFGDIGASPFRNDILWLVDEGITAGCAPYRYCPSASVTRAQMASFLVRALGLTAGTGANLFDDDDGSMHEGDIDRLATAGITSGCAERRFCPNDPVTREQMASFLARALALSAGAGANLFDDDDGSMHEGNINRLATAGVTAGCAERRYCPSNVVTREQMAAFLHRAFGS